MLHVDYIENFTTQALDVIRDLSTDAERLDLAVGFLSYRGWIELRPVLTEAVSRGGQLRVIVWRDPRQSSAEAVEELFYLPNTQVAFELDKMASPPSDYLFYEGKSLAVLTSTANVAYTELTRHKEGGAIIRHSEIASDELAQEVIASFEQRWRSGILVDPNVLADFKSNAVPPDFARGDSVRSTNDLYREYGIGLIQKARGAQAKVEFNPSVFMPPPYRSENKILHLAEIERVDTPLERAARGQWEEPWRFELKMMAARFLTGNKGGQLSNARTEILPHQIFAAHRVVSSVRRRFLLADEVGLGKTIEAGMIWQALSQRGQARRTLIVTPAGLTTQWQEEMQDKFDSLFEIFGRDFTAINPRIWDLKATAIASIDTLKRAEHKRVLLENRKWDLIIFDEAHRLSAVDYGSGKTARTENYKLAEEASQKHYTDALLLLTATPHEENHSRFKNLLLLLADDVSFSGLDGATLFDRTGLPFTELVIRTPKKDVTDAYGRKVFKGRETRRLPFKMNADEERFYQAVTEYIRDGYQMLERVNDSTRRRAAGFLLTTFQKLNASSTAAIKSALVKRLGRLNGQLTDVSLHDDQDNVAFLDERYDGEIEEQLVLRDNKAILKGEIERVESLLDMRVKGDKKLDELLRLTEHVAKEGPRQREEKILIFTEYRETQRYIIRRLEGKYGKGCVVVIHGDMKLERREEADTETEALWEPFAKDGALVAPTTKRTSQRLFRDHSGVRFLVSTEAGGEGINLQFCHICVNYDIPWNPIRVEQRVGRIYRYGQDKVVQVCHFFSKGTVEDKVQSYFEERLNRAAGALAKVTGEDPEEIKGTLSGQLESEIDPAKIYRRALVEGNLNKQTQQEIAAAVERAKRAYEIATQSLFRDVSSYSFDSYRRELASELTLVDLQHFAVRFLSQHRRQVQTKGTSLEFIVPDVLKKYDLLERYRDATFDRKEAIKRTDAQFMAIGHPFINAALSYVGSYDFGGLTASRLINEPKLAGCSGFLFAFVIRKRVTREDADECLFRFLPVFVTADGQVNELAQSSAVTKEAVEAPTPTMCSSDPVVAFEVAKRYIERKLGLWDWVEEVEFLGLSFVVFR